MTARLAPKAVFKAFRAIYNEASEDAASAAIYTYDEQNVTVNLEDRTLVSRVLCALHISIIFHDKDDARCCENVNHVCSVRRSYWS